MTCPNIVMANISIRLIPDIWKENLNQHENFIQNQNCFYVDLEEEHESEGDDERPYAGGIEPVTKADLWSNMMMLLSWWCVDDFMMVA